MGVDLEKLRATTDDSLRAAEGDLERLRAAVARVRRQLIDDRGADLGTCWLAVEELRSARQALEKVLRDAQEAADRSLDAIDQPVAPNTRPKSGIMSRVRTRTGSEG
jgi:hypothetical protein